MRTFASAACGLHVVCTLALAVSGCSDKAHPEKAAEDAAVEVDAQVSPATEKDAATPVPADAEVPKPDAAADAALPVVEKLSLQTVPYAAVASIDLSGLGLPGGLEVAAFEVTKGSAPELAVVDGFLRFITPSDTGEDGEVVLRVKAADKTYELPVKVQSTRPTEVVAYVETDEAGGKTDVPKLTVKGMGPLNALLGDALVFSVQEGPVLDAAASTATITYANPVSEEYQTIDLTKYWKYDNAARAFVVDAMSMATLLPSLPARDIEFDVSLTSVDGEFAYAWSFLAHKPIAKLAGQLVDFQGNALTGLAGKKIAVRGLKDNRTRLVSMVAADGTFTAEQLPEGTYEATVLDVQAPEFWKASFLVQGATQVSLKLPYDPAPMAQMLVAKVVRSTVRANGESGIPARAILSDKEATPSSCETAGANGAATYSASAASQNQTISCLARHTLPKGTARVGLKLEVYSAEYPTFTTQKSRYNDTWSYALVGVPGIGSKSGAVNDTHYTQGTITREACIDVSSLTASTSHVFQASLNATNIGDSALLTSVTLTVTPECVAKLSVTEASFRSPNQKGYAVIRPVGAGNLLENYISLPIAKAEKAWGLPATIRFQPKTATVTKVRMGVMVNGLPRMADENLLAQVTSKADGVLTFDNLIVPQFTGLAPFMGRTNVVFELTATVDGMDSVSTPEDGAATFNGQNAFVPMYLADDYVDVSRLYNQPPDVGGDAWATYSTLSWLQVKSYRFDDITGLHAPQTSTGRSVLDHAGHSDGTQVDMRYADGKGGFTDALGGQGSGASIKALFDAAAAEVAAGNMAGTALVDTRAWITANRANMTTEAAGARKIHAGPSWMKLALFDAKFPNGTAIPGLSAWTNKPAVVDFVEPHLHHWHVSRSKI